MFMSVCYLLFSVLDDENYLSCQNKCKADIEGSSCSPCDVSRIHSKVSQPSVHLYTNTYTILYLVQPFFIFIFQYVYHMKHTTKIGILSCSVTQNPHLFICISILHFIYIIIFYLILINL